MKKSTEKKLTIGTWLIAGLLCIPPLFFMFGCGSLPLPENEDFGTYTGTEEETDTEDQKEMILGEVKCTSENCWLLSQPGVLELVEPDCTFPGNTGEWLELDMLPSGFCETELPNLENEVRCGTYQGGEVNCWAQVGVDSNAWLNLIPSCLFEQTLKEEPWGAYNEICENTQPSFEDSFCFADFALCYGSRDLKYNSIIVPECVVKLDLNLTVDEFCG
jgi:hypothetical protein